MGDDSQSKSSSIARAGVQDKFSFARLKMEVENETTRVHLPIGFLACVVLVLVVRIDFDVLAHWEEAARIQCGGAPFAVLAFVEALSACVRFRTVRANFDGPFECQPVAIAPREVALRPIKICAVPVGN